MKNKTLSKIWEVIRILFEQREPSHILIPTPCPDSYEHWHHLLLYAACIWGEARGEPQEGKVAVAHVIRNRGRIDGWYGKSLRDVILKDKQFSCFNPDDPNYDKMRDPLLHDKPEVWVECYKIVKDIIAGKIPDNTGGATHYHHRRITPYWTEGMIETARIDNHIFWKRANE